MLYLYWIALYFTVCIFHADDTTSMGKQTCREKDETSFSVAIEALTYQSPVTRDAIRKWENITQKLYDVLYIWLPGRMTELLHFFSLFWEKFEPSCSEQLYSDSLQDVIRYSCSIFFSSWKFSSTQMFEFFENCWK